MPNDPKWRTIAKASGQPITTVISVYVHMLVDASANATERGRTQPNAEDLASALDVETESIAAVLTAMEGRVIEGGMLTGWKHRQPEKEDGSADRARAWREKQKEINASANENERDRTPANTDKDKEEKKLKTPKAPLSTFEVPDWVPAEQWAAWLEVRKAKRAANTAHALDLAVRKLDKLRADGQSPAAVLDQSTLRSWTGLFPVKSEGPAPVTATPKAPSSYQLAAEAQRQERRNAMREAGIQ
jgi:hypothetical protein